MSFDDPKFFSESLLIPHSYKMFLKKIHSNLTLNNFPDICNVYKSKLEGSFLKDVPSIKEFGNYSSSDFLRNTIFLKQAQNFGNLGKTAMIALKPILLFDAENQLFSFFINSIFHFNDSSKDYGMELIGDTCENIAVEIKKTGLFQRVINTYAIMGYSSHFSPYKLTRGNEFEKLEGDFDFTNTPLINLGRLIEFKNSNNSDSPGYISDQIDFLLLFIAASLARYKPDIWHSIVNGEFGDEIIYFKQTFNRFEKLSVRLTETLFSLYHGTKDSPLLGLDKDLDGSKFSI